VYVYVSWSVYNDTSYSPGWLSVQTTYTNLRSSV